MSRQIRIISHYSNYSGKWSECSRRVTRYRPEQNEQTVANQEEGSPSERARGSGWFTVEIKRTCWRGCGSGLEEEIKWVETIATLWLRFATTMRIKSQTVKWGYTRNGKRNERCIHSSYSVWLWGYAQPRVNVLCGGYSTRVVRARNCRNIFLSTR